MLVYKCQTFFSGKFAHEEIHQRNLTPNSAKNQVAHDITLYTVITEPVPKLIDCALTRTIWERLNIKAQYYREIVLLPGIF
jgi:hypothetical protein